MTDTKTPIGGLLGHGRYEVKRKLGEGGMAFALLAVDKTLGADVVLKVPKPNMMADPEFVRRFKREIRSMQELTHDHIVKIKDVGEHEGTPFYVMDLLAGGSLQDRFEAGADKKIKPMPPDSLADWLPQVADALDFIHQKFVHRDIKPANILFDAYGHAFVSDFGIVKAITNDSAQAQQTMMTQAGMVVGTGPYMAPEVAEGKKVDGRSDQYALAVTVYQALSGRVPFDGTTLVEIIKKQLLGQIQALHELVPTLPRSLTQVIEKGLSQEPKDRYANCAAFAKAVLAAAKTMPATSKTKAGPKGVCPACRKPFALPPDPAGKSVKCPACGAGFTVTKKSAKSAAAETKHNPATMPVATLVAPLAMPVPTPTMLQERGERKATKKTGSRNHQTRILLIGGAIVALLAACMIALWAGGVFRTNAPQGQVAKDKDGLPKKQFDKKPPPPEKEKPLVAGSSITNTIGMKLVYIPPGKFLMGSPPGELERELFAAKGSEFQHEVTLTNGFYMGAYAVTQEEYQTVMLKNPSWFSAQGGGKNAVTGLDTRRFPIEWVSWDEATEFCRLLSLKAGKAYRLPTEAEWEYACRAGTTTPFHFGPTISTEQVNYNGNGLYGNGVRGEYRGRPVPVGSFTPNGWGLYDMHGNVWQWCQDWYDAGYYENSPKLNPVNQAAGQRRVLRGGAGVVIPGQCRSAYRFSNTPDARGAVVGFRVVLAALDSEPKQPSAKSAPAKPPELPLDNGRRLWTHSTGRFEQLTDKGWVEHINKRTHSFREVRRNADWVELHRLGESGENFRDCIVHLHNDAAWIQFDKVPFQKFYDGVWNNAPGKPPKGEPKKKLQPPNDTGSLKVRPTQRTGPKTTIVILNQRAAVVEAFWIDGKGQRWSNGTITPGKQIAISTYGGHVFLVTEKTQPISVFEAADDGGRIVVGPGP